MYVNREKERKTLDEGEAVGTRKRTKSKEKQLWTQISINFLAFALNVTRGEIFNLSDSQSLHLQNEGMLRMTCFHAEIRFKRHDFFNYCPANVPAPLLPLWTECPSLLHSCLVGPYDVLSQWTVSELMQAETLNVPAFFGLFVMLQPSLRT